MGCMFHHVAFSGIRAATGFAMVLYLATWWIPGHTRHGQVAFCGASSRPIHDHGRGHLGSPCEDSQDGHGIRDKCWGKCFPGDAERQCRKDANAKLVETIPTAKSFVAMMDRYGCSKEMGERAVGVAVRAAERAEQSARSAKRSRQC